MIEIRHCYFNFEMITILMDLIHFLIRQGPRRENDLKTNEPRHDISNNVVSVASKG